MWGIADSKQSWAWSTRVDDQMCVLPARRMKPLVIPGKNVSLLTLSYVVEKNEPYKVRQCFYNNNITDCFQRQRIYIFIWGRTVLFNLYSTVLKGPRTFAKDYKSQCRPIKEGNHSSSRSCQQNWKSKQHSWDSNFPVFMSKPPRSYSQWNYKTCN